MKAMILAAGLGTRLKPWTLQHPKALVEVNGTPMLERVINRLKGEGFNEIVINIHHFGEQIIDFVRERNFGVSIRISDERDRLLDTGGGIYHARELLFGDSRPVLVHNVDILSNANLRGLMEHHEGSGADSTLLVSKRPSSRHLIFRDGMRLCGWHHCGQNLYKPENYENRPGDEEYSFSGIHVVGRNMVEEMGKRDGDSKFSIIDFLLNNGVGLDVRGYVQHQLELIDIGKPETLRAANMW